MKLHTIAVGFIVSSTIKSKDADHEHLLLLVLRDGRVVSPAESLANGSLPHVNISLSADYSKALAAVMWLNKEMFDLSQAQTLDLIASRIEFVYQPGTGRPS